MKYIIFAIILLSIISLFINNKRVREGFQGSTTSSSDTLEVTTKSLADLLSGINISNNLINHQ